MTEAERRIAFGTVPAQVDKKENTIVTTDTSGISET